MDINYIIGTVIAVIIGIIGYFLKRVMLQIDEIGDKMILNKESIAKNISRIEIQTVQSESKFRHFDEKFDMLFSSLKDLTTEIKELNSTMKKRD